jgi:AmmeMemoRadiSam system protein A
MEFNLTDDEKTALLEAARETISAKLEKRPPHCTKLDGLLSRQGKDSVLKANCGAFVTLHKGGDLRGCIGIMHGDFPLEETVRMMAGEAAFRDPRFQSLKVDELESCRLEISVLSPMELCRDPDTVEVGVHGLLLKLNRRSGVLLPQVPVEQGWNRDEYLDYISVKAGLPANSHKAPGAKLYTFTAIVFGE